MKLEQLFESELTKDDVINLSDDDLHKKLNDITFNKSRQYELVQQVTGFKGGKLGRGLSVSQLVAHVRDGSTKHDYTFNATMGNKTEFKCKVCGVKKKTKAA
jgi:hypothetical protein